ncbi:MAG TPA: pilus assembly protein PilM, partial [Pirellulaceae bacterium]|nr:pilus assembly protein PilM [Pirellulaceae bacterium]
MAKQNAVWGIDIGRCSLKALRCVPAPDGDGIVAEAFDYVEYPKILSQPDAEPEVLIREALEQFLSRNELKGDRIAISVSGQAGLWRPFLPPPVDAKTLPDLVKYEAKQVIPFQLEDVIWDYQQIGGNEVDGLILDSEVHIFAMKREAVFKALQPFQERELEVDFIQLTPPAIYNVVTHELLHDVPPMDEIDPSNPPESMVVLSMGTDTTDLVISDGHSFWQRNIPIGGNHFTKQLARELKLTYAKAEHLKRNARKAEDPKTIFQAMKPVFNDLSTELQRSLSYFQGNHKKAKLGKIVMLGNASKLPGLRQFLSTSLTTEIGKLEGFTRLGGTGVTSSRQFEENALSYAVCYGLCLQGLGISKLRNNLLPREFITERVIRAKKPWAVAAVAALLLGCSVNYFFNYRTLWTVHPNNESSGQSWESAQSRAKQVVDAATGFKTKDKDKVTELEKVRQIQQELAGSIDGRLLWPELESALYQACPRDPRIEPGTPVDPKIVPYAGRAEIYIDSVETVYFPDLKEWMTDSVKDSYIRYIDQQRRKEAGLPPVEEPAPPETPPADGTTPAGDGTTPPAEGAPAEGTPADGAAAGAEGTKTEPATTTPAPATPAPTTPAAPVPAG